MPYLTIHSWIDVVSNSWIIVLEVMLLLRVSYYIVDDLTSIFNCFDYIHIHLLITPLSQDLHPLWQPSRSECARKNTPCAGLPLSLPKPAPPWGQKGMKVFLLRSKAQEVQRRQDYVFKSVKHIKEDMCIFVDGFKA